MDTRTHGQFAFDNHPRPSHLLDQVTSYSCLCFRRNPITRTISRALEVGYSPLHFPICTLQFFPHFLVREVRWVGSGGPRGSIFLAFVYVSGCIQRYACPCYLRVTLAFFVASFVALPYFTPKATKKGTICRFFCRFAKKK